MTVDSDDEIRDNNSYSPVKPPSEGFIRLKRTNAGTGVYRLEPTNGGKAHK